jgi:hypothetical protein
MFQAQRRYGLPPHSESPMVISRKVYGTDNVGNIGASGNEPWVLINHRVVGFSSLFVALISWAVELSSKGITELLARVVLEIKHSVALGVRFSRDEPRSQANLASFLPQMSALGH